MMFTPGSDAPDSSAIFPRITLVWASNGELKKSNIHNMDNLDRVKFLIIDIRFVIGKDERTIVVPDSLSGFFMLRKAFFSKECFEFDGHI